MSLALAPILAFRPGDRVTHSRGAGRGGVIEAPSHVITGCHCYVDPLQKSMRLLGRFPCVRVDEIFIDSRVLNPDATKFDIRLNGVPLDWDEKNQLAWRDGFRPETGREYALIHMMEFWKGRLPFVGHLIHWDFARRIG